MALYFKRYQWAKYWLLEIQTSHLYCDYLWHLHNMWSAIVITFKKYLCQIWQNSDWVRLNCIESCTPVCCRSGRQCMTWPKCCCTAWTTGTLRHQVLADKQSVLRKSQSTKSITPGNFIKQLHVLSLHYACVYDSKSCPLWITNWVLKVSPFL